MKRALITGISGQDGSYLAELLLEKGYEVHGLVHGSTDRPLRAPGADPRSDHPLPGRPARRALPDRRADAARARTRSTTWRRCPRSRSPGSSLWRRPSTPRVGVTRLLEGIREACPEARFYQASSSEMFGRARETPQTETHPLLSAQPVRRGEGLWPLHHRQLPRELRAARQLGDPLQPRVAAPRSRLRHPEDQQGRRLDQAGAGRRARARQPRRAPRLGIREGVRRGDVDDVAARRARRLRDRHRASPTRSATSSTRRSNASA